MVQGNGDDRAGAVPGVNPLEIDDEIAAFTRQMAQGWAAFPPLDTLSWPDARAVAELVRAPFRQGGPAMHDVHERTVPTMAGPLRIRILDPGVAAPSPALIYVHGGGFTLFSIDTHDRLMREYAAATGFRVIAVDYPLSPEARYPVALDHIVGLIEWIGVHGDEIGVDPEALAIGGDSAGANLSLAACLRLRDAGRGGAIRAMLLNYGTFDTHVSDAAEAALGGAGAVLNRAEMDMFWANYLGDAILQADGYARPIAANVAGLPPACFVIAACDVLAEQSEAMAARMAAAGVETAVKTYPGATHSFLEAMAVAGIARDAIADGAGWLRAKLI